VLGTSAMPAGARVMTPRQRETFPPVTLGHIRGHGCAMYSSIANPFGAITALL